MKFEATSMVIGILLKRTPFSSLLIQ